MIKSIITQVFMLCLVTTTTYSQSDIQISEGNKTMSKGNKSAFIMDIPQANLKSVEKAWGKRIKEGTKEKVQSENDETYILSAVIERISTLPMNIYSRLYEKKSGVELIAFFENEDGFVSTKSNPEIASGIKVVLTEFGVEMYKEAVEVELKNEEKNLKDLDNDLKKLVDENEKLHKNISEDERKIGQIKEEINSNFGDQERKTAEIESQKDVIDALHNAVGEQQEDAKKVLKNLEKDKKKMVKDSENLHKKIDNLESEIRQFERDIEANLGDQQLKQKEILKQKEKAEAVASKLKNIK